MNDIKSIWVPVILGLMCGALICVIINRQFDSRSASYTIKVPAPNVTVCVPNTDVGGYRCGSSQP